MIKEASSEANDLVIFGSFGFGNIGDEAVPYAMQDLLEDINYQPQTHILSRFNTPKIPGVIGLGSDYASELSALKGTPGLLVGGGIIEPRNMSCILRYADYIERNQPSDSSIFMGSFEFGVKYGWSVKRRLSKLFERLDHIYTRDYLSEIYLRENFPQVNTSTVADVVLAMRPAADRPLQNKLQDNDYIVVSLCGAWKEDKQWYRWIIAELVRLSDSLGKQLVFVPMSCHASDDDRLEHQKIVDGMMQAGASRQPLLLNQSLPPRVFAALLRDAALVISMRLHGCVIAYAQQTPFVGLSYHPKLNGFSQTVGWRNFILPARQPAMQSGGQYGYKFSDLGFDNNDLFNTAHNAMEHGSFNLLPVLKGRLRVVLGLILDGWITH